MRPYFKRYNVIFSNNYSNAYSFRPRITTLFRMIILLGSSFSGFNVVQNTLNHVYINSFSYTFLPFFINRFIRIYSLVVIQIKKNIYSIIYIFSFIFFTFDVEFLWAVFGRKLQQASYFSNSLSFCCISCDSFIIQYDYTFNKN